MTQAYLLQWPEGFPRTVRRRTSQFSTSLSRALTNVQDSLRLFSSDSDKKIEGIIILFNVTLGEKRPTDSGVSVWFSWDGLQVCIPVDRYEKVEHNLQAIHHIIEARRTELRHGAGFKALPPPADWRKALGVSAIDNLASAEAAYKVCVKLEHPDNGGSHEAMAELNRAIKEAREALR